MKDSNTHFGMLVLLIVVMFGIMVAYHMRLSQSLKNEQYLSNQINQMIKEKSK